MSVTDLDLLPELDRLRQRLEFEVKWKALGEVERDDVAVEAAASELECFLVDRSEREYVVLRG